MLYKYQLDPIGLCDLTLLFSSSSSLLITKTDVF